MTPAERRAAMTADIVARTGIDEAMIARLVRTFYGKVRSDALDRLSERLLGRALLELLD